MTNEPADLLAVVDLLTLPRFEHVAQEYEHKGWKVRSVQVPPLLELFRDRVSPSGEQNAGGSAKHTRSPADLEAMFEYGKMVAAAAGWAHDAKVVPTRDPVKDLRAWYAATLADNTRDDDWYTRFLTGWVALITAHLEPPGRFTIHRPCPVCSGTSWGDAINGGDLWPIEVRYRVGESGRPESMVATCRISSCGTKWIGYGSVMELRDELIEGAA